MNTFFTLAGACAVLPAVLAHPAVLETRQSINGQSVFTSLGNAANNFTSASKRKAQMIKAGATSLDLALGMHEMGVDFLSLADWKGHSDPHGCNNWADPTGCTNGKANCYLTYGMSNNNWWQMTTSCTQFKGLGECDQAKGLIMNSDYDLMMSCQHQQMADPKFSQNGDISGWWVAQRQGGGGYDAWKASGQMDRTTKDYMNNVLSIKYWIEEGKHMTDNWVMSSNINNLDAPVTTCIYPGCGTPYVDNTPVDASTANLPLPNNAASPPVSSPPASAKQSPPASSSSLPVNAPSASSSPLPFDNAASPPVSSPAAAKQSPPASLSLLPASTTPTPSSLLPVNASPASSSPLPGNNSPPVVPAAEASPSPVTGAMGNNAGSNFQPASSSTSQANQPQPDAMPMDDEEECEL